MILFGKLLIATFILSVLCDFGFKDLPGDYCRMRKPRDCCPGRDDSCAIPIFNTLCYCDKFCNRSAGMDCCPDYFPHCLGINIKPPEEIVRPGCHHLGKFYPLGHFYHMNCNKCKCQYKGHNKFEFGCEDNVCLIRSELIDAINRGNYGWKASNYTFLWGKTLNEGIRYRLGTFRPTRTTLEMTEIHLNKSQTLPENFDSRLKWPNLIQPIRDQGDCGSSWAFSTTGLASDRLAIESQGREKTSLSPQHLISCQHRGQRGCHGGHLDRAWWYLRKRGVVTESCYPYESWIIDIDGKCKAKNWKNGNGKVKCPSGNEDIVHYFTPSYRVAPNERDIMKEIHDNGPVQATFEVKEDFFLYKHGIYRHTPVAKYLPSRYQRNGWHSVRIIGWGVDRNVKYWLCTNSWGERWGENGYFRIVRGENECDIESFIVGVWAKRHYLNGKTNGRRHRRA